MPNTTTRVNLPSGAWCGWTGSGQFYITVNSQESVVLSMDDADKIRPVIDSRLGVCNSILIDGELMGSDDFRDRFAQQKCDLDQQKHDLAQALEKLLLMQGQITSMSDEIADWKRLCDDYEKEIAELQKLVPLQQAQIAPEDVDSW